MSLNAPVPLAQQHRLAGFDCGQPALNDWLQRRALQNQQRGATRTFVICDDEAVVAYFTLASSAVALCTAPEPQHQDSQVSDADLACRYPGTRGTTLPNRRTPTDGPPDADRRC